MQKLWHFVKFENFQPYMVKDHMDLENSKRSMGECRLELFLAIVQILQNLWHFEILKWESMGKPNMWNISKTVHCSAKRTKIWDFGYYSGHKEVTSFDARFLEFGWRSFGAICKISNFTFFLNSSLLPIFIRFHPNFIQSILIMGQYRLLLF